MKPKYEYYPVLIILLLISFQGIYADQSQKILHPKFRLLDPAGMPINGDITKLSIKTSCGECHRVDYINQSNPHHGRNLKISCIACHLPPNMNESNDPNIYKAIQSPTDSNCASCHGIIHDGSKGLKIPEDFAQFDTDGPLKMKYRLTRREGAIFSGSQISDSLLNLRNKNRQNIAWDIHANRQLHCTACHFTRNNPAKYRPIRSDILHLTHDPRKLLSTDDYIRKPDHNFYAAKCRDCHDPFQIHDDLPYKKRHFQKLSCTACHIKNIKGPILRVIDQTLLNQRGDARIEIRGLDQSKSHGSTINTAYLQATSPALYPRDSAIASQTIVPVNLISHWYWVSKQNGKAVDLELLKGAIIENGQYSSAFISIFDANGNRIIERDELILDSTKKYRHIKMRLVSAGIREPEIMAELKAEQINHGVRAPRSLKIACIDCHSSHSRFKQETLLAKSIPMGIKPILSPDNRIRINGKIEHRKNGLYLTRGNELKSFYIFGSSRIGFFKTFGFGLFLLVISFILLHSAFRFFAGSGHKKDAQATREVYMYGFYERLWHWIMATSIICLLVTGFEIHFSGSIRILGLAQSIWIHNIISAILVINALLSLFYHVFTGEIRIFIRFNRNFIKETLLQTYYYIHGIFKGIPHPIEKSRQRKLNPLQQLAYLFLLNILMPFQFITGFLIWIIERYPDLSLKIGGLSYIAPLHHFGAWLFLSFLVVHLYLITTGHHIFSNLKAMISGYDTLPLDSKKERYHLLLEKNIFDLIGTLIGKKSK